jgi:hypothetical protein
VPDRVRGNAGGLVIGLVAVFAWMGLMVTCGLSDLWVPWLRRKVRRG